MFDGDEIVQRKRRRGTTRRSWKCRVSSCLREATGDHPPKCPKHERIMIEK